MDYWSGLWWPLLFAVATGGIGYLIATRPMAPTDFNLRGQRWRSWRRRSSAAARLITSHAPQGARIADLGCGDQKLKKALNGFPCSYRGYDLIPQSDDVEKIDLASDPLPDCDVTVMLGVLEYLPIEPVLEKVNSPVLVVSHLYPDKGAFPPDLIQKKGWLNVLPKAEFEARLTDAGFRVVECAATDRQHVWVAKRQPQAPTGPSFSDKLLLGP